MTAAVARASIVVESPVGPLLLTSNGTALASVRFLDDATTPPGADTPDDIVIEAASQLGDYFDGRRTEFDVPLAPTGTEFQQRVWAQLRAIPFGTTASYGAVTARLGIPLSASRAVGLAMGPTPSPSWFRATA